MASAERKISRVSRGTSTVEARLAGLEEEAARWRAEVAALQDEIRWLTGEDDDGDRGLLSPGWLSRGWARASMLIAGGGLVAFVAGPCVPHLFDHAPPPPPPPFSTPPRLTRPTPRPPAGRPRPSCDPPRSPRRRPHQNTSRLPRASAPRTSRRPPTCRSARPPRR